MYKVGDEVLILKQSYGSKSYPIIDVIGIIIRVSIHDDFVDKRNYLISIDNDIDNDMGRWWYSEDSIVLLREIKLKKILCIK